MGYATDGNGLNGNGKTAFSFHVALVCVTALITGGGCWLLFARDVPTRTEVAEMIRGSVPRDSGYLEDRKVIQEQIGTTSQAVASLTTDMTTIKIQLGNLNGKLDGWLAQQAKASAK